MIKVSFYHKGNEFNPEQAKKEIIKVSTGTNKIENRKTIAKTLQKAKS